MMHALSYPLCSDIHSSQAIISYHTTIIANENVFMKHLHLTLCALAYLQSSSEL